MLRYALRTLAARRAAFAGAFLALFCAAALVTACGTLLQTGLRGEIRTERYAGTPVLVAGDQQVHHVERKGDKTKHKAKPLSERVWLPAGTLAHVAAAPGVRAAVPELTFPATVVTDPGLAGGGASLGHAWTSAALTPLHLAEGGRPPQAPHEIVIDRGLATRAGLAPGDRVTVQSTDAAPARYTVTGVTTRALVHQSAVFFTDAEARRLARHPDHLTAIGVFPEPGVTTAQLADAVTDAVNAGLPDTDTATGTDTATDTGTGTGTPQVHTGGDRGPAEFLDAAKARTELVSMGGAIGGTSLLVAVLVVAGTFALTLQQRQRELALLRAIAATPRQVRRLIGREALLLAALAAPLGAAAGLPLAAWLHATFTRLGTVPETLALVPGPLPAFAAVAATLLVAWLAARLSARRAARARPAQALTEAAAERRRLGPARLIAGVLTLAGGVVLLLVLSVLRTEPAAMPVTYVTVLLLCVAVALLGPLLARAALAALAVPLRAARAPGHLAAHTSRANARRLASVITPLTLLTAMAGTVLFTQTTLADAADRQLRAGVVADAVVAAAAEGQPGVPGAAAEALREAPGVTAVTEIVHTTVRSPGLAEYGVQGVTPEGLDQTLDLGVTEGSLAGLGTRSVAVSEVVADAKGLHPGDTMPLVLGDGTPVTLTVAAVYARGLGFGDLTLSHALVSRHIDNPLADTVLVATRTSHPTATATTATALRDFPGLALALAPATRLADAQAAQREANAEVTYAAMGLVLAFTAIAAVNTLAMSTADRAAEFVLLRNVGATRRQVMAMLRLESLAVAAVGIALGAAICLATLTAFGHGMAAGAPPSVTPVTCAALATLATTLTLTATTIPARLALRTT